MANTDTLTLKVNPTSVGTQVLTVATGDFGYTIPFIVQDSTATALNISTYTVTLKVWAPSTPTTFVLNDATTQDVPASGTCHYVTVTGDLDTAGTYLGQLVLTKAGEELSTEQFILVVVTNASSYCALADVKAALDITGTGEDDNLARLIKSASGELDDHCDRTFGTTTATKYFDGVADELIIPDLVSVTTFKTDPGGDGTFETTLAATDYVLYPYQGPPYWKVRLSGNSAQSDFAAGVRKGVEIAGVWGYSTIPEPVKQACLEMVCRAYRQEQAGYGTQVGVPDMGMGVVFQGLSSDTKRKLDKYVRREYA